MFIDKEVAMNEKNRKLFHTFLDHFFWYASLFMSVVVLMVYAWTYGLGLDEKFFEPYSYLYYLCVLMYAIEHEVKQQLYPSAASHRSGELFVVGWIAVSIIMGVVTLLWHHDKLDKFVDLVVMTAFIAGIFGFGQAIKLVKLPLLDPKKEE